MDNDNEFSNFDGNETYSGNTGSEGFDSFDSGSGFDSDSGSGDFDDSGFDSGSGSGFDSDSDSAGGSGVPGFDGGSTIPPVPKKKKGLLYGIIAAAVVVVAVVVLLLSGGVSGTASKVMDNTLSSMAQSGLAASAKKVCTQGSVEISANTEAIADALDMSYLTMLDASADITFYANSKNNSAAVDARVTLSDEPLVNALLWCSRDALVLQCDELLDDRYGVNLTKAEANFADSVFAFDSDSYYALDEDTYNQIMGYIDTLTADTDATTKTLESAIDSGSDAFSKALKSATKTKRHKEELTIGDETINATAATVTLDGQALSEIAIAMIDWAANDANIRSLLESSMSESVITAINAVMEELFYYSPLSYDAEKVADSFYNWLDELRDEAEALPDYFENKLIFTAYVYHSCYVGMDFEIVDVDDDDEVYLGIELRGGPDWTKPQEISAKIYGDGESYSLSYLAEKQTKTEYLGKIRLKENGETLCTVKLERDYENGDFDIKVSGDGIGEYRLETKLTEKKGSWVWEFGDFESDYEEIDLDGLTLTFSESAKMPTQPEYVEVLTDDADVIEEAFDYLNDTVEDVIDMFSFF